MKLDQICRICLLEKANLKPIFEACVPTMLMSCASIQVMLNDGLPNKICTQCLQNVNKAYTFKQLCEKSDITLREYLQIQQIPLQADNLINSLKTDQFFSASEDLQQSSIFQDIFNDTTHSLVDNFASQNNSTVVSDLAETVQSLQIIAEQCLPDSWDGDPQIVTNSIPAPQNSFSFDLCKCDYCGESFKDHWTLGEHIKNHTAQDKYSVELDKHLMEHSLHKDFHDDSVKLFDKTFMCNICDRIFMDNKNLKKHLRDVHFIIDPICNDMEKKYSCSICGKKYKHNKNLLVHIRTSHSAERPFKCDICNRTYALSSSLHKHKILHGGDKKYSCSICGKKFSQSSNLNAHLKVHSGVKTHICSVCNRGFSTASTLDVHMRGHTGIKPYLCTTCDNAFASATELKKHTMKHTGEKPYSCWQCGKSFSRKETRDTHMRYHTGERPYACAICPKKYIAASHLRTHMKSHNNDRKHQCLICLKRFIELKTLRKHEISHMNNVQKQESCCNFCGGRFHQPWGLEEHLKHCRAPV